MISAQLGVRRGGRALLAPWALFTMDSRAAASPALLEEAKKARLEISPMSGAAITELLTRQYKTPQPIVEKVRAMLVPDKS